MNEAVLDSSAILALLLAESGTEIAASFLPGALLSAVNLAEIISKLCERGMPAVAAQAAVEAVGVELVDYGVDQARLTGELRRETRAAGLSLGDRACIALARLRGVPAITADRAWSLSTGFDVIVIRHSGN